MPKTALRASSTAVAALVLGAGLTVLAPSAQAASGADIVSTARSQMGSDACGNGGAGYYAPGTGQNRSCSGGNETHAWCADFAGWVWSRNGVKNLGPLNDLANSFQTYAKNNYGGLSSTPHVGDAVFFHPKSMSTGFTNYDHVAIVSAVHSNGTIDWIGGNQSGGWVTENKNMPGSVGAVEWTAGGYNVNLMGFASPYGASDPAPATGMKAQVVVNGGGAIFHGLRKPDGTWSGFGNIASQAGDIGTVGSVADAGLNGDTHVVAVGGNGHVFHTIRLANGTWGTFGDVNASAGNLTSVSKLSAVTIGTELNVLAVADGGLYHSVRHFDGSWTQFGDVMAEAGALPAPVTSASEASVNGQLQVAVVAGGRVYHSLRSNDGNWTPWGDVYTAAGNAGVASDVAVAGTGTDMQIVVTAANGAKQFHAARTSDGNWTTLTDMTSVLGSSFTATGVSVAAVDNELQATFVTTDNRILHTIRRVNGTWTGAAAMNLTGISGNHYGASITGTL